MEFYLKAGAIFLALVEFVETDKILCLMKRHLIGRKTKELPALLNGGLLVVQGKFQTQFQRAQVFFIKKSLKNEMVGMGFWVRNHPKDD